MAPHADPPDIVHALELITKPGNVYELRALRVHAGNGRPITFAGNFDNSHSMAQAAAKLNGKSEGIYVTINPSKPAVLARAANRVVPSPPHATTDADIASRTGLLIDIDPVRPSGVSATDAEHAAAINRGKQIAHWLRDRGWGLFLAIDTGNGCALRYHIELPNDEASAQLVKRVLEALAGRFNDHEIVIDTSTYNAARVSRIPGTWNKKGDSTPERPHRLAKLLNEPNGSEVVPRELLERLAGEAPRRERKQDTDTADLREWLAKRNLEIKSEGVHRDAYKFIFACPYDPKHDAAVFQNPDGRRGFHCFHVNCKGHGKGWRELCELLGEAQTSGSDERENDEPWPEPEPLGGELPPVPTFDVDMLPDVARPLAEDVAERMQVPLDFPAVVTILCLAGVVGRRAMIRPKDQDPSWLVVPNLWGGLVALPGFMKSPTINTIAKPLTRIEALWRHEYESIKSEYEFQKEEADLRHNAWRDLYKAAQKSRDTPPVRPDNSLSGPVLRRLITHDATFEKLHEILANNSAGIFVIRDELSGWLATLDKPGREGERAFFLTAWNGDSGFTMDRVGRGSVYVEHCCISMLGAITPARLRTYLIDTLEDGPTNDGLLQRFQLLVYPDAPKDWRYVNRAPNEDAITKAQQMYERLIALDVEQPLYYCFDDAAQQLFVEWLSELQHKLRDVGIHTALVSHLAKYRKLMPALALLFELADDGSKTTVSFAHARQAAAFCEYLESHARRIYSMVVSPERAAAAELGRHLLNGWKRTEGMFTVRDVYQNDWSGLNTPEKVRPALEILLDAGWIRLLKTGNRTGRPSQIYAINPRLHERTK